MPPITLDKAAISSLKSYRIASNLDYAYLALKFDKDPANSTQVIDTNQFQMDWGITNTDLLRYLQNLESRKAIKISPSQLTVNWGQNESTTMTQQEVLSMKKDGLINSTTYVYYALLLTKGAGLQQIVNPTTYAANPWMIEPSTLMQELTNISGRTNDDKSPVMTLGLTSISIIWLIWGWLVMTIDLTRDMTSFWIVLTSLYTAGLFDGWRKFFHLFKSPP